MAHDVYVEAYRRPGGIRGTANDCRNAAKGTARDVADADQLIDRPMRAL